MGFICVSVKVSTDVDEREFGVTFTRSPQIAYVSITLCLCHSPYLTNRNMRAVYYYFCILRAHSVMIIIFSVCLCLTIPLEYVFIYSNRKRNLFLLDILAFAMVLFERKKMYLDSCRVLFFLVSMY